MIGLKGDIMNEYSLEYIENMRIHELRDYARRIGVSSPTTMRKEELIDKIGKIIESRSEEEEFFDKLSGKEKKIDFFALLSMSNDSFLQALINKTSKIKKIDNSAKNETDTIGENNTIVMKKEYSSSNDSYDNINRNMVAFKFNISQNPAEYGDDVDDVRKGYVYVTSEKYGIVLGDNFLSSDRNTYIPESTMQKFNIQMGDCVTGKVKTILADNPKVMTEIISIDGCSDAGRNGFNNFPYNGIGENLYLDKFKLDVKKGERIYIEHMSLEEAVKLGYDIVDENSASVKFLNVKALPEDNYKSHQKLEIINCQFNRDEKDVVMTLDVVTDRIKREFENRKSNVLVIYNFSELIRIVNARYQGVYDFNRFDAKAVNKITNALCLAKFFDNTLYTTVICIDKSGVSNDLHNMINTELKPLFNKIFDSIESK